MKIAVVGLGKLGLPVALALERGGHELVGWDTSEARRVSIDLRVRLAEADYEPGLQELLDVSRIKLTDDFAAEKPEIILVCVQTPHQQQFEGVTPLDAPPADFNYQWLRWAVEGVGQQIDLPFEGEKWDPLVVIVSTCLPGTFERELRPLVDSYGIRVVYHPLFIAMGSVIHDFTHPEFLLCGHASGSVPLELDNMYQPLWGSNSTGPRWKVMSITSAELTKVAYNAFIGFKLMLANGLAMLAEAVNADVDDVLSTLKVASDRLISPAYLNAGMGDGGACHPRDQIALSWLAREKHVADIFEPVIRAREDHARWLAEIWRENADLVMLEKIQLGLAYKPDSNLRVGSHAMLLHHYVEGSVAWDDLPSEDEEWPVASYFLATPHTWFVEAIDAGKLPGGSVLVDPWGIFDEVAGVRVVRPGRNQ